MTKCPNCGAKLNKTISRDGAANIFLFTCYSSAIEGCKPLIRCTKGEKSFKKVKVDWINRFGENRSHILFDCSFTYAINWWNETIVTSQGVLTEKEKNNSKLKFLSVFGLIIALL